MESLNQRMVSGIRKGVICIGCTIYAIMSCYAYEQVFFEVFIGEKRTYYRSYELILIAFFFLFLCVLIPSFALYKRRYYFKTIFVFSTLIPLGFVSVVSFSNLGLYLGKPLYVQSELQKSDAIIVINLGNFYLRSQYAAALYHQKYADTLVVFAPLHGPYLRYLENTLSLPRNDLVGARQQHIINTYIEAMAIKELFDLYGWHRAIVVSDPFHIYRVLKTLQKAGVYNVFPAGVPDDMFWASPAKILGLKYQKFWDISLENLDFLMRLKFRHRITINVLHEYVGICFYWLKGYL